ncbi:MAG TPA: TolC family protein, partial [Flavitalea sp.]|nr:TolC family protein [Flavitalea sp.]
SLNLTVPLFNGLQARNNIRLAKIEQKNQELISATTKNTIQQAVEQAYINMATAKERQQVLLRQVAAFGASFQSAEIRFNAGVGNSVDYLTAKNNYDKSKTNLINAQYDRVLKNMVLQYYNGENLFP